MVPVPGVRQNQSPAPGPGGSAAADVSLSRPPQQGAPAAAQFRQPQSPAGVGRAVDGLEVGARLAPQPNPQRGTDSSMKGLGGLRSAILNVTISDTAELYECYMPFVNHGGLFIPTKRQYQLGDEVFVVLELLDEADKYPLTGKVVWITPLGVVTNRKQGI